MNVIFSELLLLFLTLTICTGLYEDQIGKFEWRQQYVGKLKFSHIDIISPIKKVIAATEQNVLTALSLKSGEIIWRHVFEQEETDNIRFMSVDDDIVTVSGYKTPLVRTWELEYGHLISEWNLPKLLNKNTKWLASGQSFVEISFTKHSHIDIVSYATSSGTKLSGNKIAALWLVPEKCMLQNHNIVCLSEESELHSIKLNIRRDNVDVQTQSKALPDVVKSNSKLGSVDGSLDMVSITVGESRKFILLSPEIEVLSNIVKADEMLCTAEVEQQKLFAMISVQNEVLQIKITTPPSTPIPELSSHLPFPAPLGTPLSARLVCQLRKDQTTTCRLLVTTSHHDIVLVQHPGQILWSREEALASIVSVQMVDLPMSDTDAALEKEFDNNKDSGFVRMFFRRLLSQSVQLQNLFLTVMGLRGAASVESPEDSLVRDEFGLHKLIVAATSAGKLFALDNLSGRVVWTLPCPSLLPFPQGKLPLFELRSARHLPLPPLTAVLGRKEGGDEALLLVFNPITGELLEPPRALGMSVRQCLQLNELNEDFIKGLLLLDDQGLVHVYPDSAKQVAVSQASSTYMFTANPDTGLLEGFSLVVTPEGRSPLLAARLWQTRLGQGDTKLLSVVGKSPAERVHSQGRVLWDRSVLYKHVNPNLVAVVTEGRHAKHKTILNIHLIDAVTGSIALSMSHRRARAPVHLVHSENWLVYSFYNDKHRRTELAALELHEGKVQSNATAFSSMDGAGLLPIVERQAFILPANVLAMKETTTEKGITSKHILVALGTGGILELPWMYVDPRRPTGEPREEGVIPYMPELHIPLEAILNHNQTVQAARDIYTSQSGLESTCLVFVAGLDLFYTRVAPSKTFDLLKDDFDYFLITAVLLALTLSSYLTRRLASRKALKQAWQ